MFAFQRTIIIVSVTYKSGLPTIVFYMQIHDPFLNGQSSNFDALLEQLFKNSHYKKLHTKKKKYFLYWQNQFFLLVKTSNTMIENPYNLLYNVNINILENFLAKYKTLKIFNFLFFFFLSFEFLNFFSI